MNNQDKLRKQIKEHGLRHSTLTAQMDQVRVQVLYVTRLTVLNY